MSPAKSFTRDTLLLILDILELVVLVPFILITVILLGIDETRKGI